MSSSGETRKYLPAQRVTLDTTAPATCPFDGPSHDFSESVATGRIFCRKCCDQIVLGGPLAELWRWVPDAAPAALLVTPQAIELLAS